MALMPVCSGSLDRLASGDARGDDSTGAAFGGDDRPLPSSGLPSGSTTRPKHGVAHRHAQQPAGALDFVALVDLQVIAQDDHADGVLFEVEGQPDDAAGKLDHFAGHDAGQAVDPGNAVAHLEHAADFADVDLRFVLFNFLLDY